MEDKFFLIDLGLKSNQRLGNRGELFPISDTADLAKGLCFIPGEVTVARRKGEDVAFEQPCGHPCCWYWQFKDGSRTYYWERWDYENIAHTNGREENSKGNNESGVGSCPDCGNIHTSGGHIEAADL